MTKMRIFAVWAFIGAIEGEITSETTETRETASSFLSRAQRIFFWEEAKQGNLERECIEEVKIDKRTIYRYMDNFVFSKETHATGKKIGRYSITMNCIEKAGPSSKDVSPSSLLKM